MFFTRSPYLKRGRLADVVAAVQVIGAAPRPEREIANWTKELSGNREQKEIDRWTTVFKEHPEFFHVYTKKEPKAALRVRYANKLYDAVTDTLYTLEQKEKLEQDIRARLTTKPLDSTMIAAMTSTAIALHARASEDRAARRWWVPILAAALGFLGAIVGAFFAAQKAELTKKSSSIALVVTSLQGCEAASTSSGYMVGRRRFHGRG